MRKLALLLCVMMLMSICSAEINTEGYPIVDEPITLRFVFAESSQFNTHTNEWSFVRLEQETGIHIEVERIDNSVWDDKKPLLFTSGDLPDVIVGSLSTAEVSQYYAAGQLTDLDDMIEYMPDYMAWVERFDALERAKLYNSDGHMLGFVGSASEGKRALPGARVIINAQWLENLELEMPTDWESLVTVLTAFRDEDPNGNGEADEIPLSGAQAGACDVFVTETLGISNEGSGVRSEWYEGEDGSLEFLATSDLYKTFLERMNFLYSEKLIDQELYTQTKTQFLAKGANMQIGACRADAPFVLAGTDPANYEQYVGFGPIAPEDGDPVQYFNEMYGMNLYVTSANQHRVETARLLNFLYTEDWALICRGPEKGSEILGTWDGEGGWYWLDEEQTEYTVEVPSQFSGAYYWRIGAVANTNLRGGWGYSDIFYKERMADTDVHLRAIYSDFWDKTVPCFPQAYSLSAEEMDTIALIDSELKAYIAQMEVKFIIGELSIEDNWDAFQQHLEDIGVETYVSVNQAAYSRYLDIVSAIR